MSAVSFCARPAPTQMVQLLFISPVSPCFSCYLSLLLQIQVAVFVISSQTQRWCTERVWPWNILNVLNTKYVREETDHARPMPYSGASSLWLEVDKHSGINPATDRHMIPDCTVRTTCKVLISILPMLHLSFWASPTHKRPYSVHRIMKLQTTHTFLIYPDW